MKAKDAYGGGEKERRKGIIREVGEAETFNNERRNQAINE